MSGSLHPSLALKARAAKMAEADIMAKSAADHGVSIDAGSASEQSKFQTLRELTV